MNLSQEQILLFVGMGSALALLLQVFLVLAVGLMIRAHNRERATMEREVFGLLRKLEGITATKREQILRHYDSMLDTLSLRLPPAVAAQTSKLIVDTESRILTRLAELEPNLKSDEGSRKKMDELIKQMEHLEETIVLTASDAVRSVMLDSRRTLFDDERSDPEHLS
ncbi:MAG: hypothetical protein EBZ48_16965 [Proteobacteria bacterium]|nr:hypothetical protein [Pseudomonadota bacterium]